MRFRAVERSVLEEPNSVGGLSFVLVNECVIQFQGERLLIDTFDNGPVSLRRLSADRHLAKSCLH